jgi:NAD(P)-dependent dehydrogenase (short-subunit alcohol dehydrogenase family)
MSFKDKVIALTGAGQGIGLATARTLASRGASLSLADANPARLSEVEQEFKANDIPVLVSVVDVRKGGEVNDWIAATIDKFGRLDGAANIAGTVGKQWGTAPVADIDDDDWNLVMGVNVTGTMRDTVHHLSHFMTKRSDFDRRHELSTCRSAAYR